jgi:G3E family GTPase
MSGPGEPADAPLPFTILTGYLGAGKTTVLNRVLAVPSERRVAVLVNELGRIAIDGRLILSQGGDILELAGGCVCCKVETKNDLWDGIADVVARSRPDHVVLETTGIAEPDAILEGMARRLPATLQDRLVLAGVVAVVDGEDGVRALERRDEARAQVASADRLILSKLDRASADQLAALHAALDRLGGDAERAGFAADAAGDRALAGYLLEVRDRARRAARPHAHVHRQGQLTAISVALDAPLHGPRLVAVVEAWRERLHRVKGFVHLAGDDRRGFLELAGASLALSAGAPWGDDARRSELVFIGEDLDEAALRRQLAASATAPEPR